MEAIRDGRAKQGKMELRTLAKRWSFDKATTILRG
jgi:hypothetical protein